MPDAQCQLKADGGGLYMANRWLLKTDPEDCTYDKLERTGKAVCDAMTYNLALQSVGRAALVVSRSCRKPLGKFLGSDL
jgi:hypothetical protein